MTDEAAEEPREHTRVLPAALNDRQIRELYIRLERIDGRLTQLLGIKTDVERIDARIIILETAAAVSASRRDLYARVVDGLWAVLLALIATGVWFNHPT